MERWLGFDQLTHAVQKLDRLEQKLMELGFSVPDVLPLLASQFSLPVPDRHASPDIPAIQRRQQTLVVLVEWLLKEAKREPLLVVWEDLHWADPSTIELLGMIIESVTKTATPLLTLMTFRPDEFHPPWAGLASATEVLLGRLERTDVEEMIGGMTTGRSLPREVVDQIIEKAEGVPLFVEEFVQGVLDAGSARENGRHYVNAPASSPITIPASLSDSLMSRLDRLGDAKMIAQRGAILGRTFSQDLLRAVLDSDARDQEESAEVWLRAERGLAQLVEAGVLRQAGTAPTTFEFKHALIQDAAYQSLLHRTRQAYHLQTARVLESRFASRC